jgi:hypothetical protein
VYLTAAGARSRQRLSRRLPAEERTVAEADRFLFSYKELVESLVKKQGIHEGLWMIYMEFRIQGANVGESKEQIFPAAIVPLVKVGIQRIPKDHQLADSAIVVDAAVVNPLTTA